MRIFVVDDNIDSADTMADLLRHYGHDVAVAYGSRDALDRVAESDPQLMLLDITMPGMDGLELARTLIEGGMTPTSIVTVTGMNRRGDRERAESLGLRAFLVKPVAIAQVREIIAELEAAPDS